VLLKNGHGMMAALRRKVVVDCWTPQHGGVAAHCGHFRCYGNQTTTL